MEKRISPTQVARLVGVHVATVWRWLQHGVKGKRLVSRLIGGRRYVMQADLDAFLAADDNEERPAPGGAEGQLQAELEAELAKLLE